MKWNSTKYPGVRYKEHPTRKHGIQPDKYFAIRYMTFDPERNKKVQKEEGVGWASEGMSAELASETLGVLKKANREGHGEKTLSEKRQVEDGKRLAEQQKQTRQKEEARTFADVFEKSYLPHTIKEGKKTRSYNTEQSLFAHWIKPSIGTLPFKDITDFHLNGIKSKMLKAGKAPRTVQYMLAVVRQVFNYAGDVDHFNGPSPVKKVKLPRFDNGRQRFLSREEADTLLDALRQKSQQVYEMALVSLHCGLRAGEIFSLAWSDIDLVHGTLSMRDTKSGRNRTVFMSQSVMRALSDKVPKCPSKYVFPSSKKGNEDEEVKTAIVSKTFDRTVAEIGLNDGKNDRRQRVTFHTLRHSFASWLAMAGTDLHTIQRLLGHSTQKMTERYSHLAPDRLKTATAVFDSQEENRMEVKRHKG